MSKSLECEERVMLSIIQYKNLLKEFANSKPFTLVNEYYDDPKLTLINNHKMLRVRNLNRKGFELTLKIKGKSGDLEINEKINYNQHYKLKNSIGFPKGEIKEILKDTLPLENIRYITKLKTIRYERPIDNYLLVLDKNFYNGFVDYDLEVEAKTKEKALKIIKKYCTKYNIDYSPKYKGKSRRAVYSVINEVDL